MSNDSQPGSDAFQWLDEHMEEVLTQPDEAFDWIFMLQDDDWLLLESVWANRSVLWREGLAYLLSEGPVEQSWSLLLSILFDPDQHVALQAADSLASLCDSEHGTPPMPDAVKARLDELLRTES